MPGALLPRASVSVAEVPRVTSHDLCVALKLAHPLPDYACLFEVREGGTHGSRADALVVSTFASRGFEICGFEFKVARGDWLGELKNPHKADRIARYCDRWTVFAPTGVVREGELPVGWGLWELLPGGTIRRSVQATTLEPEPMPRSFMASLMRARAKLEPEDHVALIAHHRREWEMQQRARETNAMPATLDRRRVEEGLRKLETIREATGIDLLDFTPTRRWIERLKLVDSPRFEHKLKLLRDLFADDELRARVEHALGSDVERGARDDAGSRASD